MPKTIFPKKIQRFFIEPQDKVNPDNTEDIITFANQRLSEYLDLLTILDNKVHVFETGRSDRSKEHFAYEITFANPLDLAKVYKLQINGTLPMTLWTAQGNGPKMRYAPAKTDLKKLLKIGTVVRGGEFVNGRRKIK